MEKVLFEVTSFVEAGWGSREKVWAGERCGILCLECEAKSIHKKSSVLCALIISGNTVTENK